LTSLLNKSEDPKGGGEGGRETEREDTDMDEKKKGVKRLKTEEEENRVKTEGQPIQREKVRKGS